jgi:putative addiction module component (TIGR02574 family)
MLKACNASQEKYLGCMPLTNLTVAEEALSLSPTDRAALASLLIQSLEGDRRTDDAIKAELNNRLEQLRRGVDHGLTFEEVFNAAP